MSNWKWIGDRLIVLILPSSLGITNLQSAFIQPIEITDLVTKTQIIVRDCVLPMETQSIRQLNDADVNDFKTGTDLHSLYSIIQVSLF